MYSHTLLVGSLFNRCNTFLVIFYFILLHSISRKWETHTEGLGFGGGSGKNRRRARKLLAAVKDREWERFSAHFHSALLCAIHLCFCISFPLDASAKERRTKTKHISRLLRTPFRTNLVQTFYSWMAVSAFSSAFASLNYCCCYYDYSYCL